MGSATPVFPREVFDDGTSLPVAPDALVHQADGSYRLTKSAGSIGAVDQSNAVVIPVVAEELTVEKEQIVRGKVRMHRRVETREEVVNTPIFREEVRHDELLAVSGDRASWQPSRFSITSRRRE